MRISSLFYIFIGIITPQSNHGTFVVVVWYDNIKETLGRKICRIQFAASEPEETNKAPVLMEESFTVSEKDELEFLDKVRSWIL